MVWLYFYIVLPHLKLTLLLGKQGFVNSQMVTTIDALIYVQVNVGKLTGL